LVYQGVILLQNTQLYAYYLYIEEIPKTNFASRKNSYHPMNG
jgi:hypothetical protein